MGFWSKLFKWKKSDFPINCPVCGVVLNNSFVGRPCKYCNINVCDKHRQPENHNCVSAKIKPYNTAGPIYVVKGGKTSVTQNLGGEHSQNVREILNKKPEEGEEDDL